MARSLKDYYRAWRYRYKVDPAEIRFLLDSIKPGDRVVDVGAYEGACTYWMQRKCGHEGTCFAFETQPNMYRRLTEIYSDVDHVLVYPLKISDRTGTLGLPAQNANSAPANSPVTNWQVDPDEEDKHTIDTTTLDDFFQDETKITFVKIAVKGHEFSVLRGASRLLLRDQPRLLIECEARHIDHSITDVFLYLEQLGYAGFFFQRGQKIDLKDFDVKMHQKQDEDRFWMARDYVKNFIFL